MNTEYRIEPFGSQFAVIDVLLCGCFRGVRTNQLASIIARCEQEDAMYETAKQLVDMAVNTLMQMFGVDRETASYWIRSASDVV